MTTSRVDHSTFVIERTFGATVERVFATWSNPQKKRRWFACHDDWKTVDYQLDFREGGVELNDVAEPDGTLHAFKGRYLDIVANQRIVYVYDMSVASERLSVSLVTVTFAALGQKTKMTFTEQVVFLDGKDNAANREEGLASMLDKIGESLAA